MRREYVQWLRGDAIREAVDIYFHVDPVDVRRSYLASIPQLGILEFPFPFLQDLRRFLVDKIMVIHI